MATGAVINYVFPESIGEELELTPGDIITKINGQTLKDLIDYRNLMADEYVELEVVKPDGEVWIVEIDKEFEEDLGLTFETSTFDGIRRCRNKCIFCFVDQMPKGLRDTLYVKDDDYRMSLLHGNFITLTNLSDEEMNRIITDKLGPIYISVHTTQGNLRQEMLNNKHADKIMIQLTKLASAKIGMHTQIVTCPGINDGEALEQTVFDLATLSPHVLSIAIVPVGLTKFRENLVELRTFTKEEAVNIVNKVESWQQEFRTKLGFNLVYLADEFYLKAEKPIPTADIYDDFCQVENGVGLARLFLDSFNDNQPNLPSGFSKQVQVVFITGVSGVKVLGPIVDELNKISNLEVLLQPVENNYFGKKVTVTGLLTGTDIEQQLKKIPCGPVILIPSVMFREGTNVFLDNMSLEELRSRTGHNIKVVSLDNGADDLIKMIRGCDEDE